MNLCKLLVAGITLLSLGSCGSKPYSLTEEEKKEGWIPLFDGQSMDGWHLYNKGKVPSAWHVDKGILVCDTNPSLEHGDLVTDLPYENYHLKFDWKLGTGGNSGVFINVVENPNLPAAWFSGPEYQLLDSAHIDYAIPTKRAGCLYGFQTHINEAAIKPAGEWSHSEIKQQNGKVELFLNGALVAKEDFRSQAWKDTINATYFKNYPAFGKATKGLIGLQDWRKGVAFKDIKIKTL